MEAATSQEGVDVSAFPIGRCLQVYLSDPELAAPCESCESGVVAGSTDSAQMLWNRLLGVIAEERQQGLWRHADGIKQEELALFLRDHVALDLGASITAGCGVAELSALPFDERSDKYHELVLELQAIKTMLQAEESP